MQNLLAQIPNFGNLKAPAPLLKFGDLTNVQQPALGKFLNLFIQLLIIGAGIYAFFNLILAGYGFLSAGDDSKKVEAAWGKIWQTAIGLLFVGGSFVLAALFGWLIYGDPNSILNPSIPNI